MNINEKGNIVYELLELLKANKISNTSKKKIYIMVNNMNNRTDNQKEKFCMFYNLLEKEKQNYRLCDMARYYNCTSSNIRSSIGRIRNSLVNTNEENILIMKNILKEYHDKN